LTVVAPVPLVRFLGAHALSALAGLTLASACLAIAGTGSLAWLALGHGLMLAGGLVTGAWLIARHGEPLAKFLPAMLVGIALRMLLVLAGAVPLGLSGTPAFLSYLGGLAAAFVPMQVHEVRVLRARAIPA
jgi:hypothetical protein